ncbi:S41 family peptidase [Magnetococcus sp. PR-3]|uniref:S41 family peptidase n=1 Tax=Magnetococcus sp. PR-3 TaxID=3120355 RepID=UPI002FCE37BE
MGVAQAWAAPDLNSAASLISKHHIAHPTSQQVPVSSSGELQRFLSTLDPYSQWIDYPQYRALTRPKSSLGLGAMVLEQPGGILMAPIKGGAVWQAGIQRAVFLTGIAGVSLQDKKIGYVAAQLQGRRDIAIRWRIPGQSKERISAVKLGSFTIPTVELHPLTNHQSGVLIRIHSFLAHRTALALQQALLKGLAFGGPIILDLRYAPGGSVLEAVDAASLFLDEGLPIVTMVESDGTSIPLQSTAAMRVMPHPVVVLIGPGTASAAELFVRALKFHGAAWVVGQGSFGKCLTQRYFQLPNGSGLKLTVGHLLGPDGVFCEHRGVQPHFIIRDSEQLHDTPVLLEGVMRDIKASRLVCLAQRFNHAAQARRHVKRVGWHRGVGKLVPYALQQSKKLWRLCLSPPLMSSVAEAVHKRQQQKSIENMVLLPLP